MRMTAVDGYRHVRLCAACIAIVLCDTTGANVSPDSATKPACTSLLNKQCGSYITPFTKCTACIQANRAGLLAVGCTSFDETQFCKPAPGPPGPPPAPPPGPPPPPPGPPITAPCIAALEHSWCDHTPCFTGMKKGHINKDFWCRARSNTTAAPPRGTGTEPACFVWCAMTTTLSPQNHAPRPT
jgi:hypothetical protein